MKRATWGFGLLVLGLMGCPPGTTLPGAGNISGGGEASGQCGGDFGAGNEAQKLEAFLLATAAFTGNAADLQTSLWDTCKRMGVELGIPEGDLQGDMRAACDLVSAKIRSEMTDLRAQARLTLSIAATPPRCEVRMDAYAQCAAECQANVDPGQVQVECEGGEIVGTCSAECTGRCAVDVQGECSGKCEGTCEGGCTGQCNGTCEGRCRSQGPDGQCQGRCDGTCHGSCSAGCRGSCSGKCEISGQASCSGECRGGCSVAYQEPRCTGTVRPPSVEAECKASCDARLNAEAHCEPGGVTVVIKGSIDSNIEDRVNRLRRTLEQSWGSLLAIREKLQRLSASGQELARTAGDIPGAVGSLGLRAVSCATEAAAALPRAVGSVGVSVEVSVSVSASASAG